MKTALAIIGAFYLLLTAVMLIVGWAINSFPDVRKGDDEGSEP